MNPRRVSIVRYRTPGTSVRRAVELAGGLPSLKPGARVFIKPNIVFWTRAVPFPKWGVITTSRVVEDTVALLKEQGVDHITIGEGMITATPGDRETPAHAFATLGYDVLARRYGVETLDVMASGFVPVEIGAGTTLKFCARALESDLILDLPVLKTHNQTVVSLSIKNLKGLIDIPSRKKCHSLKAGADLHTLVARLADPLPPVFTVIDGIYTAERGPAFDGKMHRSDLLIASADPLSADLAGARVLGYDPAEVPHLACAARNHGRPADLSDLDLAGEPVAAVARFHAHDFDYARDPDGNLLPTPLIKQGIRGLSYPKYDATMCTYCAGINGVVLAAIRYAWQGEPFDDVEVLTGKAMSPTPGRKKTILLGRCMYRAHKDDPRINEMIAVKGCPPDPDDILKALRRAGIAADPALFAGLDRLPGFFMARYEGKPEFDETHFRIEA